MLTTAILGQLRSVGHCIRQQAKRHLGLSAVALQKADLDPVQQLFAQKVREYAQKRKAAGGKLVDATSEDQKHLKEELDRVEQRFEAVGKDMSKFPAFNFEDKHVEGHSSGEKVQAPDLPL